MKQAILAGVLVLASSSAFAAPALVVNNEGCGMPDGNGQIVFTTETHRVATQSTNGNAMFRCNAMVTPPASGQAAHFDFESTGLLCGIQTASGFEVTEDGDATISAEADARLTCRDRD